MSSPATAQSWETERRVDGFTDETQISVHASGQNGGLRLSVNCLEDGSFLVLDESANRRLYTS